MKHLLWIAAVVAAFACGKDKSKDTPKAMEPQTPAGAGTTASAGPSAPKTPDKESESPGNAAAVAVNKLDICTLVTPDEASDAMGVKMKRRAEGGETTCVLEAEDSSKPATIDIQVQPDGAAMMTALKNRTGSSDIAGVGDAAAWTGTGKTGQLGLVKGKRGVMVTITAPGGTEARAVADKISAKIASRFE